MDFLRATTLMLLLLNPFLVILYLLDVVRKLEMQRFVGVLVRGAAISVGVFWCFAILGDAVFRDLVHVSFASFQIFGGVVFLLIGLQFVFRGPDAIEMLRGESEDLPGAIAMPVMIGPGTISASVVIGESTNSLLACLAILVAVVLSVGIMVGLKWLHDWVRPRREQLVQRYIAVTGRITALYVGTVSIEMIMTGLRAWLDK